MKLLAKSELKAMPIPGSMLRSLTKPLWDAVQALLAENPHTTDDGTHIKSPSLRLAEQRRYEEQQRRKLDNNRWRQLCGDS